VKKIIIKVITILLLIVILSYFVPHSTTSTQVGVRIVKWSFFEKKGVSEEKYVSGATYFFHPFINDWKTFEIKEQQLEMTLAAKTGTYKSKDDLLFKTIDGNDISLDLIITYKINPDSAPYIIQNVAENDFLLQEKIVRTIARSKPRDIFGQLNTEEFYVAEKRDLKSLEVKENLNKVLNPLGVLVLRVGTKDYRFNEKYTKAIEDKKVAEQQKRQFESAALAAAEEWKTKLNDAVGQYNQMVAKVEGQFREAVLEADAYYVKQQKTAEAIIAEGNASAEAVKKRRLALLGSGGLTMLKLKYAEVLKNKNIMLLPLGSNQNGDFNIKTMDVNKLIDLYGIKSFTNK
jgi:regulator of protease activity HflC (stomatin/prohibitin superfamily)